MTRVPTEGGPPPPPPTCTGDSTNPNRDTSAGKEQAQSSDDQYCGATARSGGRSTAHPSTVPKPSPAQPKPSEQARNGVSTVPVAGTLTSSASTLSDDAAQASGLRGQAGQRLGHVAAEAQRVLSAAKVRDTLPVQVRAAITTAHSDGQLDIATLVELIRGCRAPICASPRFATLAAAADSQSMSPSLSGMDIDDVLCAVAACRPSFAVAGGPSCSGKSTFLKQLKETSRTDDPNKVLSEPGLSKLSQLYEMAGVDATHSGMKPFKMDHGNKVAKDFKRKVEGLYKKKGGEIEQEQWRLVKSRGVDEAFGFLLSHLERASESALAQYITTNAEPAAAIREKLSEFIADESEKTGKALLAHVKAAKQAMTLQNELKKGRDVLMDTRATDADTIMALRGMASEAGFYTVMVGVTINDPNDYLVLWLNRNGTIPDAQALADGSDAGPTTASRDSLERLRNTSGLKLKGWEDLVRVLSDNRRFGAAWDRFTASGHADAFDGAVLIANGLTPESVALANPLESQRHTAIEDLRRKAHRPELTPDYWAEAMLSAMRAEPPLQPELRSRFEREGEALLRDLLRQDGRTEEEIDTKIDTWRGSAKNEPRSTL